MAELATLEAIVAASAAIRATKKRLEKRRILVELFQTLDADDLALATTYLSGVIPQGALGVGWRTLHKAQNVEFPLLAAQPPVAVGRRLTLQHVDRVFTRIAEEGDRGSAARKVAHTTALLDQASDDERAFIVGLLGGGIRQGALRAQVADALACAFDVALDDVRRALMFSGDVARVARALLTDGADSLATFVPRLRTPIEPMLATTANTIADAMDGAVVAAEYKLDGIRIQLHRDGEQSAVFSRKLKPLDVPEAVQAVRGATALEFILDGEVTGRDANGRPLPFQDLVHVLSLAPDRGQLDLLSASPPARNLEVHFFDVLTIDDRVMIDAPYTARREALIELVGAERVIDQIVTGDADVLRAFYEDALAKGYEGIIVKQPNAPYTAGRRGGQWRKLKPVHTLDLVLLAAEWGSGRRTGWLSNLHLGARHGDRFVMLGKTFKGLTDAMLKTLTETLPGIQTKTSRHVVEVRPELVVEIGFDTVQRSPRYDSGYALRFARVKRLRFEKPVADIATLDEVLAAAGITP